MVYPGMRHYYAVRVTLMRTDSAAGNRVSASRSGARGMPSGAKKFCSATVINDPQTINCVHCVDYAVRPDTRIRPLLDKSPLTGIYAKLLVGVNYCYDSSLIDTRQLHSEQSKHARSLHCLIPDLALMFSPVHASIKEISRDE